MRVKSLEIFNIRSFSDAHIAFNGDLNIIIGPNASGKSNLLDIVNLALRTIFIRAWGINNSGTGNSVIELSRPSPRLLDGTDGAKTSSITLGLEATEQDMANIATIKGQQESFRSIASRLNVPLPALPDHALDNPQLRANVEVIFPIYDWNLGGNVHNSHIHVQLQKYLELVELYALLSEETTELRVHRVLQYFAPHRGIPASDFRIHLSSKQHSEMSEKLAAANSRESSPSAAQLGMFYFADKLRRLVEHTDNARASFNQDPEVQLVTEYLSRLGYKWTMELVNHRTNEYEFQFELDEKRRNTIGASSGQKELINFLLGMFAANVRGGCVLIDEPELHLHPTWQTLLLDLLIRFQRLTGNQLFLATHAPGFVTEETIAKVIRLDSTQKKVRIQPAAIQKSSARKLMQMVNSQNNEKLFFSNVVILVEGQYDKLVLQTVIDSLIDRSSTNTTVSALAVGGKYAFAD